VAISYDHELRAKQMVIPRKRLADLQTTGLMIFSLYLKYSAWCPKPQPANPALRCGISCSCDFIYAKNVDNFYIVTKRPLADHVGFLSYIITNIPLNKKLLSSVFYV
jgi:hypothetical protein